MWIAPGTSKVTQGAAPSLGQRRGFQVLSCVVRQGLNDSVTWFILMKNTLVV